MSHGRALARVEPGMDRPTAKPFSAILDGLVVHQRDQRPDHQRRGPSRHTGQLISRCDCLSP